MDGSDALTGLLVGALGGVTASSLTQKKELPSIAQALKDIANERKKLITIYVESTLDQPVNIQILGAPSNPPTSTVPIGSSFTVNPGSADFRTLIPEQTGWTPYITTLIFLSRYKTILS